MDKEQAKSFWIELLGDVKKDADFHEFGDCDKEGVLYAAARIEELEKLNAELQQARRWVSVSEQYPEPPDE